MAMRAAPNGPAFASSSRRCLRGSQMRTMQVSSRVSEPTPTRTRRRAPTSGQLGSAVRTCWVPVTHSPYRWPSDSRSQTSDGELRISRRFRATPTTLLPEDGAAWQAPPLMAPRYVRAFRP